MLNHYLHVVVHDVNEDADVSYVTSSPVPLSLLLLEV